MGRGGDSPSSDFVKIVFPYCIYLDIEHRNIPSNVLLSSNPAPGVPQWSPISSCKHWPLDKTVRPKQLFVWRWDGDRGVGDNPPSYDHPSQIARAPHPPDYWQMMRLWRDNERYRSCAHQASANPPAGSQIQRNALLWPKTKNQLRFLLLAQH